MQIEASGWQRKRENSLVADAKFNQLANMKLSISVLITVGLACQTCAQRGAASPAILNSQPVTSSTSATIQSRLIDRCCQVGKERAIESPRFNCKLSAREALIDEPAQRTGSSGSFLALSAETLLASLPSFADQCEMVLESCCMGHHRTRNCDSGKQFAKSGAACMDVELSKEATIATESFNDCCMSCSLGILAAKGSGSSASQQAQPGQNRCKLMSPLASSLSGQLYEQTYTECCLENVPKPSGALLDPGAPIDCGSTNPCSQRCVSGGLTEINGRRQLEQDKCDCFQGYKLGADGVSCIDIDECKLGLHSCNKHSEVCDNTRGSFRCLARQAQTSASLSALPSSINEAGESLAEQAAPGEFVFMRLCPVGSRWNKELNQCQSLNLLTPANQINRNALSRES